MKLIAHRGNISGKQPDNENKPSYINDALDEGYDAEVDVWFENNKFYLCHDNPLYEIKPNFLMNEGLWCHAKNVEALAAMRTIRGIHYFWHETDDYTLTSNGFVWVYPNKELCINSICVMPEQGYTGDINNCYGICSDELTNMKIIL